MPNRGVFAVNPTRTLASFTDGLSNSLLAAEVKANQKLYKSCALPGSLSPTSVPSVADSRAFILTNYTNGCKSDTGHVKWSIGSACYDGFTTALPPNTAVLVGTPTVDIDYDTTDENNGGPTFAAITSWSAHPGGFNALLGDGSVRFFKSTINGARWRAIGSIAGGEVVSSDQP